jgi:outer membrane protein assembly factor BamD
VAVRRMFLASATGALFLALAACGSTESVEVLEDRPVEELYNTGMDQLAGGQFTAATQSFNEVERQHPFSIWAPRAQLMSAYAHFSSDHYDDAIIALDRFIQLHPSHESAPYANYLRAITYYEQIVDVVRDQAITRKALESLDEVVRRYPNTDYARDAKLKRDLAFDHLAGKEMQVGRYYQREGSLVAAMNRFTYVLVNYQTTTHAPEALHRLVESHMVLGMKDEATKYAAVLGHNFPSSQWYSDSYALLTGERVEVDVQVADQDFIDRSIDYLFSPNYQIGSTDPDAEILGTGIESQTNTANQSGEVTRAAVQGDEDEKPDLVGQVASTVAELPPPAAPSADEGSRLQIESLLASAREQRTKAETAADGWTEYAGAQNINLTAKARGEAQAKTSAAAGKYWAARENLLVIALRQLDGTKADAAVRTKAETQVAETGLAYWQTVAEHGLTNVERELAQKNAADAEKALAFWRKSGRSWLDRVLGSST